MLVMLTSNLLGILNQHLSQLVIQGLLAEITTIGTNIRCLCKELQVLPKKTLLSDINIGISFFIFR